MTTDTRKERTQKAIYDAMIILLKKQPFDSISTITIAKTAGISRASFYTYFKDKYDMIDQYQQALFIKLEYIFEKYHENKEQRFIELFYFLKQEELLASLISYNGTKEIQLFIMNKIRILINSQLQIFHQENITETEKEYRSVFYSSAFFGLCQAWIEHQKKESPEEMTRLLLNILPD